MSSPFLSWTFSGQNGLTGAPSTYQELPDGRRLLLKDPDLPAVLEDRFILHALQTSRRARWDFCALFPGLDPISQERLTNLIMRNKRASRLILSEHAFAEAIQKAGAPRVFG